MPSIHGQKLRAANYPSIKCFVWLLATALVTAWATPGTARGQAQNQDRTQQPSASPAPSSNSAQAPQEDSVAEAARKAKAKIDKPAKTKVYTETDLAGMHSGVSVVGHDETDSNAPSKPGSSTEPADAWKQQEQAWRLRAQKIHDQMDALDQQIKNIEEDIKKNGALDLDLQSGLKKNIIYENDKYANIREIEKRKKGLEKQLDQLQDEARKAGVPPGWAR